MVERAVLHFAQCVAVYCAHLSQPVFKTIEYIRNKKLDQQWRVRFAPVTTPEMLEI